MKVELFGRSCMVELQKEINTWIEKNNIELIDMKFSTTAYVEQKGETYGDHHYDYNVLVIYR